MDDVPAFRLEKTEFYAEGYRARVDLQLLAFLVEPALLVAQDGGVMPRLKEAGGRMKGLVGDDVPVLAVADVEDVHLFEVLPLSFSSSRAALRR